MLWLPNLCNAKMILMMMNGDSPHAHHFPKTVSFVNLILWINITCCTKITSTCTSAGVRRRWSWYSNNCKTYDPVWSTDNVPWDGCISHLWTFIFDHPCCTITAFHGWSVFFQFETHKQRPLAAQWAIGLFNKVKERFMLIFWCRQSAIQLKNHF